YAGRALLYLLSAFPLLSVNVKPNVPTPVIKGSHKKTGLKSGFLVRFNSTMIIQQASARQSSLPSDQGKSRRKHSLRQLGVWTHQRLWRCFRQDRKSTRLNS